MPGMKPRNLGDYHLFQRVDNSKILSVTGKMPIDVYDSIKKIAKLKGMPVMAYIELCFRRIVQENKELLK